MGFFDFFKRKKKVSGAEAHHSEVIFVEPIIEDTTPVESEIADTDKKASAKVAPKESKSRTSAKSVEKVYEEDKHEEVTEDVEPESTTISESKHTRTGKFEIKRAKDGRYHFNLYASNRVLIARSQIYSSSTKAMQGIKSVVSNAPRANMEDQTLKSPVTVPFPKWEIYIDNGGKYRFRLCATNGSCICHSRGYTTKSSCKSGIESIKRFAEDAEINKIYLDKK